jgi:hypothetical protein
MRRGARRASRRGDEADEQTEERPVENNIDDVTWKMEGAGSRKNSIIRMLRESK